jgi:mannose-6-phosphate isomerase-like protein (cupin superfamily)
MSAAPRCVVAGLDANGKSCVVHDAPIPFAGGAPVMEVASIWSGTLGQAGMGQADNAAPLEDGLAPFSMERLFGPFYNFMYVEYAPGLGKDDPGMHFTNTADHFFVLEGEVVLVLESGDVPMRAGDAGVCRGVMHGWRNVSDRPARLITFVLPAAPLPDTPASAVPLAGAA